jgi:hypothetical protein
MQSFLVDEDDIIPKDEPTFSKACAKEYRIFINLEIQILAKFYEIKYMAYNKVNR